jgi:hypothetical protein
VGEMETTFLIYLFLNLGVVCLFVLLLSLKHLLFCKTIERRIWTTCFPAKNCFFCEVGKLKAKEKQEKQLLVKIRERVVSLMLWNFFVLDFTLLR